MKKQYFILMVAVIVFSLFSVVSANAETGTKYGDLYYEISSDNTSITITDCDPVATEIIIPKEIDGLPVTTIGSNAFYYCGKLKVVAIPDSITTIEEAAFFYCPNLTSIGIADSVTSIGDYAFASCEKLTSIKIPSSVTNIGDHVFSDCNSLSNIDVDSNNSNYISIDGVLYDKKITSLIRYPQAKTPSEYAIPDGVAIIKSEAFSKCSSLTNITIPDSVISIENSASAACKGLINITIPSSVISIGDSAFQECLLEKITLGNSVNSIADSAFKYCSNLIDIIIPDSVTNIGDNAFYCCYGLTSITIPRGVTSIGDSAFTGCRNVTSIAIPDSVTSIGISAFSGCGGLADITISGSVTSIGDNAFLNTAYYNETENWENGVLYIGNHLIKASEISSEYIIKNGTKTIANRAFQYCENLKSVVIPDSVIVIGINAFSECSLENVVIGRGVTIIGERAFAYNNMSNITIPDCVTSIGGRAFAGCSNLNSIIIPDSVTSIGSDVFLYCPNLNIYYTGTQEAWDKLDVKLPNGVTVNSNTALVTNLNLRVAKYTDKEVTLEFMAPIDAENVIVEQSTDGQNWVKADIREPLTKNSTTAVILNFKRNTIYYFRLNISGGKYAGLSNTTRFLNGNYTPEEEFNFSNGVIKGYNGVFEDVSIPSNIEGVPVTSIGESAFEGNSNLTSIFIGKGITNIGKNAFSGCQNLKAVYVDDWASWCNIDFDIYTWNNGAYGKNCSCYSNPLALGAKLYVEGKLATGDIILPNNVTHIGEYAFWEFNEITSLTIPSSVKSIGCGAFYRCDNLTAIYITDLASWCNIDFDYINDTLLESPLREGCNPLYRNAKLYINGELAKGDITIPDGAFKIDCRSFYNNCNEITSVTIPFSVKSIENDAVNDWSSLTDVHYMGTKNDWLKIEKNNYDKLLVKVPIHCSDGIINPNALTGYSPIEDFEMSGSGIEKYIGTDTTISIPPIINGKYITKIWNGAFDNCPNLVSVIIPYSFTEISGFSNCTNLQSVTIPNSAIRIGNSAFWGCESLTSIKIPDSVTNIGNSAFRYCRSLESVTLSDYVTNIGNFAFNGCDNLTSIYIDDWKTWCNIDFVHDYTQYPSGKDVEVNSNPLALGAKLYLNGNLVDKDIQMPNGIISIKGTFYKYKNITSITIPNSVIDIGYCSFEGCDNLTDVYYTGTEEQWNSINISDYNSGLTNANIHYNYDGYTPNPQPAIKPNTYTIENINKTDSGIELIINTNENVSGKQTVMAACYDEKGVFIGLQQQQISASEQEQTVSFDIESENTATVKAFIWNALDYMMPASNPVSLEL